MVRMFLRHKEQETQSCTKPLSSLQVYDILIPLLYSYHLQLAFNRTDMHNFVFFISIAPCQDASRKRGEIVLTWKKQE